MVRGTQLPVRCPQTSQGSRCEAMGGTKVLTPPPGQAGIEKCQKIMRARIVQASPFLCVVNSENGISKTMNTNELNEMDVRVKSQKSVGASYPKI